LFISFIRIDKPPLAFAKLSIIEASVAQDGPEELLDTRGLLCPLPVLRAQKRLAHMNAGAVLRVLASDPLARLDFPRFCEESGHRLLSCGVCPEGDFFFVICRADPESAAVNHPVID
jgi:tRNA 2-thiouridine synthesizing protein A